MLKAFAAKQVKVCPTKGNQRRQQRVACGKQQQQQLRQGKSMSRFLWGLFNILGGYVFLGVRISYSRYYLLIYMKFLAK